MGIYLNPSPSQFRQSLNSQIFVDKSGLIDLLNQNINTRNKYICVSRPRRFGKSFTAEMICAYYAINKNSSGLFAKLKIAGLPSYRLHLNQYHTIFINMQSFLSRAEGDVRRLTADLDLLVKDDLQLDFPDVDLSTAVRLYDVLNRIYARKIVPEQEAVMSDINRCSAESMADSCADSTPVRGFVFVIDEWDCVMREKQDDTDGIRLYLDYLRALLKDQNYVSLAYMTGILPIKKYGSHSALNMFEELSMTEPGNFAEYTGFTEGEVRSLCDKTGTDFNRMKRWYDGYSFLKCPHVYNPNSVVRAIRSGKFASYWTQTETFESLSRYIDLNMDGLRDEVIRLVAGEAVVINTATFQNDMTSLAGRDDVLTLLVHLGYLSVIPESGLPEVDNDKVFAVHVPNEEIRKEFRNILRNNRNYRGVYELIQKTDDLLEKILSQDNAAVASIFDDAHQDHTSILKYNDENSLACVVALALSLRNCHEIN